MDMEGKSDCRTREGHFLGERTVANFHTFKYNLWQYVDGLVCRPVLRF